MEIIFNEVVYLKYKKEKTLPVSELEFLDVLDANRYKKDELQERIINFVAYYDFKNF